MGDFGECLSCLATPNDQSDRRWDAFDSVVRSRFFMTLDSTNWTLVTALITIALTILIRRLLRPFAALLFAFLPDAWRDWQIDQFRVILANTTSAPDAFFNGAVWRLLKTRSSPAWGASVLWLAFAFSIIILSPLSAFAVSKLPAVAGNLRRGDDYVSPAFFHFPDQNDEMAFQQPFIARAFDRVDSTSPNYTSLNAAAIGLHHPEDRVYFPQGCPDWAPVCNRNRTLLVGMDYWITPRDLGVGGAGDVRFGVSEHCYLTEFHSRLLEERDGYNIYGVLYGDWVDTSTNKTEYDDRYGPMVTDTWNSLAANSAGAYEFTPFSSTNDTLLKNQLRANDTIRHAGDLTLLVLTSWGVRVKGQSNDALFATTNYTNLTRGDIRSTNRLIDALMCNTTYSYCVNLKGDEECTTPGRFANLKNSVSKLTNLSLSTRGFLEVLTLSSYAPPIGRVLPHINGVLASQTLVSSPRYQIAPEKVSGRTEVLRLMLSGRQFLIAGNPAYEYWKRSLSPITQTMPEIVVLDNLTDINAKFDEPLDGIARMFTTHAIQRMCSRTLIDDSQHIIVACTSIVIIAVLWFVIILLTIPQLTRRLFLRQRPLLLSWRTKGVGQLHRLLVEQLTSKSWPGLAADEWPQGVGEVPLFGTSGQEVACELVDGGQGKC